MPTVFLKFLGLVLIFISSAAFGFYKSFSLRQKQKNLLKICKSVSLLGDLIRTSGAEKNELLEKAFGEDFLSKISNCPSLLKLEKNSLSLLGEFLNSFGSGDAEAEYNRSKAYCELFYKEYYHLEEQNSSQCKLYSSLGVLFGIGLCIFFL